jgi:pimeloyl-ACP methyl ester carboxylesterase
LQEIVKRPAVVYGHSLGGQIGLCVAARYPHLVKALIVGDAPPLSRDELDPEDAHQTMNVLWRRLADQPIDRIEAALREMPVPVPGQEPVPAVEAFGKDSPWFHFQAWNLHHLDPGVLDTVLDGPAAVLGRENPEELLRSIICPALLLQADPAAGGSLSDAAVSDMLSSITHSTHVRLDGIGHELHGDPRNVPSVVQAIEQFLANEVKPGQTRYDAIRLQTEGVNDA